MKEGPEAILDFHVLDESDDYIVIDKPAPLIVHPSNGRIEPTLLGGVEELLSYDIANGASPAIITRLDRETSGIVLIAKHTQAARELAMALQNREAHKEYLAIVHGHPTWQEITVDEPIIRKGLIEESAIWLRRSVHPTGRKSTTHFKLLENFYYRDKPLSLVQCIPITGRTHQIRVHLSHINHPIIGDKIYGCEDNTFLQYIEQGWTDELRSQMIIPRQALHASKLSLPWQGKILTWECSLPKDMEPNTLGLVG